MIYIDDVFTVDLITPFTGGTITPATQPNIVNSTDPQGGNSFYANISSFAQANATNSTQTVNIWDAANYVWNATLQFLTIITGGFLWSAFAVWGLDPLFLGVIHTITGGFIIITIIHIGRSIF